MLVMILIDVQYLQDVVLSFEKGWNGQIHSSSDSHHSKKNIPAKFPIPPTWRGISHLLPFNTTWKTLERIMIKETKNV